MLPAGASLVAAAQQQQQPPPPQPPPQRGRQQEQACPRAHPRQPEMPPIWDSDDDIDDGAAGAFRSPAGRDGPARALDINDFDGSFIATGQRVRAMNPSLLSSVRFSDVPEISEATQR